MQFYDLFPVSVLHENLGREITQEEMDVALYHSHEQRCDRTGPHRLSNERYVLHTHERELMGIKRFIMETTGKYIHEVLSPAQNLDVEFILTNSWFTYNESGGEHKSHVHQNCILSGVFYFTGNDAIDFVNYSRFRQVWLPQEETNHRNEESRRMQTQPGDLFIFPPDLYHAVPATDRDEMRICMPYNIWLRGHVGSEENINAAHINWETSLP